MISKERIEDLREFIENSRQEIEDNPKLVDTELAEVLVDELESLLNDIISA